MANTKNYTENGGSVTHIGGILVLDTGAKLVIDGLELSIEEWTFTLDDDTTVTKKVVVLE